MAASNDGYYEAYWPRTPRQTKATALARRLETLNGRTIAQLWDEVYFGDEIFLILEEELKKRFPGVKWVSWKEFGYIHSGDEREVLEALPRRFKELGVDAAILGMAC